jgi:hypothetical protein
MKVLSGRPRPGGGATWPPACPSPRRPRWICASTRSPQWARTQCAAARGIGRTQPRHRRTARNQRERCKVPCLETLLREAGAGLACRPPSGGGGLRPSAVSRGSKISPGFTTAPEEVSARALPMSARSCCFTKRSNGNRPCFQWPIIRWISSCGVAERPMIPWRGRPAAKAKAPMFRGALVARRNGIFVNSSSVIRVIRVCS